MTSRSCQSLSRTSGQVTDSDYSPIKTLDQMSTSSGGGGVPGGAGGVPTGGTSRAFAQKLAKSVSLTPCKMITDFLCNLFFIIYNNVADTKQGRYGVRRPRSSRPEKRRRLPAAAEAPSPEDRTLSVWRRPPPPTTTSWPPRSAPPPSNTRATTASTNTCSTTRPPPPTWPPSPVASTTPRRRHLSLPLPRLPPPLRLPPPSSSISTTRLPPPCCPRPLPPRPCPSTSAVITLLPLL